jgi:hypothetical protein
MIGGEWPCLLSTSDSEAQKLRVRPHGGLQPIMGGVGAHLGARPRNGALLRCCRRRVELTEGGGGYIMLLDGGLGRQGGGSAAVVGQPNASGFRPEFPGANGCLAGACVTKESEHVAREREAAQVRRLGRET